MKRAKFYVAVTRAEITTGIVVPDNFCISSDSTLTFWQFDLEMHNTIKCPNWGSNIL